MTPQQKPKELSKPSQARAGLIQKREGEIVRGKEKKMGKKKGGRWLETKKVLGTKLLCLAPLHQPSLLQECRAGEGRWGSGAMGWQSWEQDRDRSVGTQPVPPLVDGELG